MMGVGNRMTPSNTTAKGSEMMRSVKAFVSDAMKAPLEAVSPQQDSSSHPP